MRLSKSSSAANRSMFSFVACASAGVREVRQDRNGIRSLGAFGHVPVAALLGNRQRILGAADNS